MPHRELRSYPTKYATDLTDAQWAAIAPLVVTSSPKGGRPTDIDRRAIVNALRDNHRTGCQWRLLPTDVPPMSSVRYYFDPWNRDGPCITINDTLRKLARQAPDRDPEPSISVLDSQSTKTTEAGGERGFKKKVNGRKRQFWVDATGFYDGCWCIPPIFRIPKAPNGSWPHIINRFLCERFAWTRGRNKGEMHGWKRTRRCA
jgi:putative transposase